MTYGDMGASACAGSSSKPVIFVFSSGRFQFGSIQFQIKCEGSNQKYHQFHLFRDLAWLEPGGDPRVYRLIGYRWRGIDDIALVIGDLFFKRWFYQTLNFMILQNPPQSVDARCHHLFENPSDAKSLDDCGRHTTQFAFYIQWET